VLCRKKLERLRTENKFLNDRNSQLSDENEHLKDLNAGITQKYDDLKQEYEALLKENRSLRQQLQSSVHSNYTKQEPKKENLTPTNCSIPKNYNFINSMPKQSAEPRSAAPNKPSVQQNERKLFNDTTSSNQRVLRKS
jgi:predicted  nucleic acid-binding Zn-ribbon protein